MGGHTRIAQGTYPWSILRPLRTWSCHTGTRAILYPYYVYCSEAITISSKLDLLGFGNHVKILRDTNNIDNNIIVTFRLWRCFWRNQFSQIWIRDMNTTFGQCFSCQTAFAADAHHVVKSLLLVRNLMPIWSSYEVIADNVNRVIHLLMAAKQQQCKKVQAKQDNVV